MEFNRTWFVLGYLFLLIGFGALAVYSFARFGQGITQLPQAYDPSVRLRETQTVDGAETSTLPRTLRSTSHLLFAGDVMLSRYVDTLIQRAGTPDAPWELIADATNDADLFFVNLEAPFADTGPYDDDNMVFRARPKNAAGLAFAGVDAVSFANNHFLDAGQANVAFTKHVLTEHGIAYAVPQEPALVTTAQGWTIGITADAYNLGLNQDTLRSDIAALRERGADFIVSSMHAGTEYAAAPNSAQQTYAHAAIDAGADLVVGHHPHVPQTIEEYNGGYIVYSLGNFIFDQFWSEDTMRGQVLNVALTESGPEYALKDIRINTKAQPSLVQ